MKMSRTYNRLGAGGGGGSSTTLILTCVISTFIATVFLMSSRQLWTSTSSATTTTLTSSMGNLRQQKTTQTSSSSSADKDNYIDPSFFSNFHHELIVPEVNEDWVSFAPEKSHKYFTREELDSMPDQVQSGICDSDKLPDHCCIGAYSMAGMMRWNPGTCPGADFMRFPAPHDGDLGYTTYQSIDDMLELLGEGKTLTFVGDSVTSQHAHAMECAWLRKHVGRTSNFTRHDYERVFKNGAFNPDSQYGVNVETHWEVEVPPRRELGETRPTKSKFIFYLMYRPSPKDMIKIAEEADVMVVNFGLHYLMFEKKLMRKEATEMFEVLKEYASTPGKVLIWREVSAQFFLGEGGEWPGNRRGLGMSEAEYNATKHLCHAPKFGRHIPPQWRDKIYIDVAKELGFELSFLGSYNRAQEPMVIRKPRRQLQTQASAASPSVDGNATTTTATAANASHPSVEVDAKGEVKEGEGGKVEVVVEEPSWLYDKDRPRVKPVLYWLPFFRLTSETLHLRPYNFKDQRYDCTHFCYTPYMWDPMIDGMATAMRRHLAREQEQAMVLSGTP